MSESLNMQYSLFVQLWYLWLIFCVCCKSQVNIQISEWYVSIGGNLGDDLLPRRLPLKWPWCKLVAMWFRNRICPFDLFGTQITDSIVSVQTQSQIVKIEEICMILTLFPCVCFDWLFEPLPFFSSFLESSMAHGLYLWATHADEVINSIFDMPICEALVFPGLTYIILFDYYENWTVTACICEYIVP